MIRYAIGLVAAIALLFGAFMFGHHVEHMARVAEVSRINSAHDKALADANAKRAEAEQAARDTEAKRVADMASLDANYQKELSDAKTVSDRTIADLQSGNVRLRQRFTCNAGHGTVSSTGKAGTSTSSGDAAGTGGLRQSDADFLVRLADAADRCAIQVKALQDVVRKDRDAPR
jgi:hypothetical protein